MATGTFNWYGKGLLAIANGDIDWAADTIYVMMATSSYTPDKDAHDFRDDVTNEVSGTNYTAGGKTIGTHSTEYDAASDRVRFKIAASTEWTSSSISNARNVILYKYRAGASSADELIGYATLDADTSSVSGTFTLDYDDTDGVLYIDCT